MTPYSEESVLPRPVEESSTLSAPVSQPRAGAGRAHCLLGAAVFATL